VVDVGRAVTVTVESDTAVAVPIAVEVGNNVFPDGVTVALYTSMYPCPPQVSLESPVHAILQLESLSSAGSRFRVGSVPQKHWFASSTPMYW
jgi:hypothetical protein